MRVLRSAQWASPLLSRLEHQGGICSANMPLLFEVRIAYALHRAGVAVTYEHKAGAGRKSADFHVHGEPGWLIEAVRLAESDAIKAATKQSGNLFWLHLSSRARDRRQTEEGELIKAIERIEGKASKFPPPTGSNFHVIIIDVRGYLGHGGDCDDYREMAYGTGAALAPENAHWWNGQPILGLFDARNSRASARLVQQHVHYLGFVQEKSFDDGEIQRVGFYLPNLMLFDTVDTAATAFAKYPLRR